jgi:purine-binding chemotaxis protein CheW
MDFLEIRRKAKERAAARAAAEGASPAGSPPGQPGPSPAFSPQPEPLPPSEPSRGSDPTPPHRPLGLDALPLPAGDVVWTSGAWPEPAPPAPAALDPEAAEAAARLEAALMARLQELPTAADARFRTWRPDTGSLPDLAPIAPEPEEEQGAEGEPSGGRGRRGRRRASPPTSADPLDDFFYREDESGPELGALATPAPAAAPAPALQRDEYLTFLLGVEEYGVEIGRVREVMRSPPITEVPRAPADVLGVITVRGDVVAVFDPRGRLGLPRGPAVEGGRVVIVDDGAGPLGMLVDGVANVVRLRHGSIEPCPQGVGGASADCLEGVGRDGERIFTVLSVAALLRPTRRAAEGRG